MNWNRLKEDPIPPEIIDGALNLLVEIGHIEGNHRTTGSTWLAERVFCHSATVSRWRNGEYPCGARSAFTTRTVLIANLREGLSAEAERLEDEAMDLDLASKTAFDDEDYGTAEELSKDSAELVAQAAEFRAQLATLTN